MYNKQVPLESSITAKKIKGDSHGSTFSRCNYEDFLKVRRHRVARISKVLRYLTVGSNSKKIL